MQEEKETLEQEQPSSPYTQQQMDALIYNGIRPEGMPFEEFKFKRAYANKMLKTALKGKLEHVSSWIDPIEGTKYYRKMTKTYIKPKEQHD
jgi:hypothetical protein